MEGKNKRLIYILLVNTTIVSCINFFYFRALSTIDYINPIYSNAWETHTQRIVVVTSLFFLIYVKKLKWTYIFGIIGFSIARYQSYRILYDQALTTRFTMQNTVVFFGCLFISLIIGLIFDFVILSKVKQSI